MEFPSRNTGMGCHFLLQGSSWPRDWNRVSCLGKRILYQWATREDHTGPSHFLFSVQFSSVAQSCPTLRDPMDCSTPGLPVHRQLPEFTQTHVHWVIGNAIQPSYLLPSLSSPAFNLSHNKGLFQWVSSSHQVANIGVSASISVLPMNIQDWFPLGWTGWISLQSKGLSRVFSNTTVQKHQFFSAQLSL